MYDDIIVIVQYSYLQKEVFCFLVKQINQFHSTMLLGQKLLKAKRSTQYMLLLYIVLFIICGAMHA